MHLVVFSESFKFLSISLYNCIQAGSMDIDGYRDSKSYTVSISLGKGFKLFKCSIKVEDDVVNSL